MIEILHSYISQFIKISLEDYAKTLEGWQLFPIKKSDEIVGAVMKKNNEIHAAVLPQFWNKWAARDLSKQHLIEGIAQHGFLVTSAAKKNPIAQRFVERLGFYSTGENENFIHYRIDHAKIK